MDSDGYISTIVYLEDSEDEVFLTRLMLKRENVQLALLHFDRFTALEAALQESQLPQLDTCVIIIDLNLTLSNGIDAVAHLRSLAQCRHLVIGICTGSEDPADRIGATEAGADFFVSKPLNLHCLETICESVDRLDCETSGEGGWHMKMARAA